DSCVCPLPSPRLQVVARVAFSPFLDGFFFQAEDGIRDRNVTGVQTCALPICLWFVYGDCYCADKSYYERIADTIKDGVSSIPDVDFGETKELGRVNKVDPLGITYLRIRGMWG